MKFKQFFTSYKENTPRISLQLFLIFIGLFAGGVKIFLAIVYNLMLKDIKSTPVNIFIQLAILSIFVIFFSSILSYIQSRITVIIEQKIQKRMQDELLDSHEKKDFEFLESEQSGEWITLLSEDVSTISTLFTRVILPTIAGGILFTTAIVVGAMFSWKLVIVIIICSLFSYFLPPIFSQKIEAAYNSKMNEKENINNTILNILQLITTIKSFQYEDKSILNFKKVYKQYAQQELAEVQYKAALKSVSIGTGFVVGTLWMIVGGFMISNNTLTLGAFTAFLMLNDFYGWPFSTFPTLFSKYVQIKSSRERVATFHQKGKSSLSPVPHKLLNEENEIQYKVRNLDFSYQGNNEKVLKNLTLAIPKGKKIGVIGQSGSGKSTFSKLLLGLYVPDNGSVQLINQGTTYEGNNIFNHISYVPQVNVIFNGTIKENINLGNMDFNDNDIIKACKLACAHDFIQKLENGYDTLVGSDSELHLSGGQVQRIAIARALLKKSEVYIFDEFTSSLDNLTEKKILDNLKELSKTMIFVAHKKEVMDICDTIYDLSSK